MISIFQRIFLGVMSVGLLMPFTAAFGQVTVNGVPATLQKATLFLSPSSGSFLAGSTFEVSLFLDTRGGSANAIEANLKFPTDKLTIVSPSSGKSIIGVWLAPPAYSNSAGSISFTGIVPGGIVTKSGLIATITFKAKASGEAVIRVLSNSQVLANDGVGTSITTDYGRATLNILPRPPEGPRVFSETHPIEDKWYNSNNVTFGWEKDPGVLDFSYALDDKPFTIPDNTPDSQETRASFEAVPDGIKYFHIKSRKDGVWGQSTHFAIRIDTLPPAKFYPHFDVLAAIISRVLVSFSTTDSLSGMDHYEVGVIDRSVAPDVSPAFVEAESPYQLPTEVSGSLRVIVRAFDRAGNVQDGSVDIGQSSFISFLARNGLLIALLILMLSAFVIHRLFGDHIIGKLRAAWGVLRRGREEEGGPQPPQNLS